MLKILYYWFLYSNNKLDPKLERNEFKDKMILDICSSGLIAIKVCQWMSHRTDLFSKKLIDSLKPLLDRVPNEHDIHTSIKMIKRGLNDNNDFERIFLNISNEVIGSGSISQVHKCKLHDIDVECVVKVHHNNIMFNFKNEKSKWEKIIWAIDSLKIKKMLDINGFIQAIEDQLMYRIEYDNYIKIKSILNSIYFVKTPTIYHAYPNFITMSYEEGYTYTEISSKFPEYLIDMSKKLMISYFWMVYKGHVHCDMHDGNTLYVIDEEDDNKNKIIILDFGLGFFLETSGKMGVAFMLWKAFITQDIKSIYRLLEKIIIHDSYFIKNRYNLKKIDAFRILKYNKELSFNYWLEDLLEQISFYNFILETKYMYVFMGFIILGRSFVLRDEITGELQKFDVFGSSLKTMSISKNKEMAEIGKELLNDFLIFSNRTNTNERINTSVIYDLHR